MSWFRVSVDFDAAGNAIARSYEARDDHGELVALACQGCDPFDDHLDLYLDEVRNLRERFGLQLNLF